MRRVVVCDQSVLWFFVGSITKMKFFSNSTNFVEKYNMIFRSRILSLNLG